jgi:hypothetical protein
MGFHLGQTAIKDFCTNSPTTGEVIDADSTPTIEVYEDDNDTPILTPTPVKRTSKTGNYRVSFDMTIANGFEITKSYNVTAIVVVGGITSKKTIASFILEPPLKISTVATDGGNTITTFKTNLTESSNNYWKDCFLTFYTGDLAGQTKKVSAYDGTTKFITVSSAFTATPSDSDKFFLVNL